MPIHLSKSTLDKFSIGCSAFLFSMEKYNPDVKHQILRNFMAKSISQLQSVYLLHSDNKIFDCYILYRGMVDRLGHLYYLSRTQEFQLFDDWSFIRLYESNHKALSHDYYGPILDRRLFTPTAQERERYRILQNSSKKWSRPNIENEFKARDIDVLYKFGYDHASKHVHPMANDGLFEYYLMCQDAPEEIVAHYASHYEIVIQNACLIAHLTIQECLNCSEYQWLALCYNFLSDFLDMTSGKPNDLDFRLHSITELVNRNEPLCRIRVA